MSLFSPKTKNESLFEIQPDELANNNVMSQVVQNMQGQLDRIEQRVTSIEAMVRAFTPQTQSTSLVPVEEEVELKCNKKDYERFNYLVDAMSHPLVSTSVAMCKMLEDTHMFSEHSTIKNMIRRMRHDDNFDVEVITRLTGSECLYRITHVTR